MILFRYIGLSIITSLHHPISIAASTHPRSCRSPDWDRIAFHAMDILLVGPMGLQKCPLAGSRGDFMGAKWIRRYAWDRDAYSFLWRQEDKDDLQCVLATRDFLSWRSSGMGTFLKRGNLFVSSHFGEFCGMTGMILGNNSFLGKQIHTLEKKPGTLLNKWTIMENGWSNRPCFNVAICVFDHVGSKTVGKSMTHC